MSTDVRTDRYHALDCVRASAMLLGVFYHSLQFRMFMGGGMGMGPPGFGGPSRWVEDFLHSFRMPLFFLISGFFGRMILEKYGTAGYLRRRWQRIGVPLLIGMFTFSPAYVLTRDLLSPMPGFGGGPPGAPDGGPGGFPFDPANLPPPPPGLVPPPLIRFDLDTDGSLSTSEWEKARGEMTKMAPPGDVPRGGPGFRPGGPPGGPGGGPFGRGGGVSERLFGSYSRLFALHHLWFLWYLLVFVTVSPWVARAVGKIVPRQGSGDADRLSERAFRLGVVPLVLGLASAPVLMFGFSPFGWGLGLPGAIFRAFPDFLLHLDLEMAFFYLYFITGWWLHRERAALPDLARNWSWALGVGLAAFVATTWLSGRYGGMGGGGANPAVRAAGYGLYSVGAAFFAFAFLGFFQTHLNRPSPTWRYLADTALWVYLIHQPIVLAWLAAFKPLGLPWWAQTPAVAFLSAVVALLMYEAFIRPTPLVHIYGPAVSRRVATVTPTAVLDGFEGEPSDARGERPVGV